MSTPIRRLASLVGVVLCLCACRVHGPALRGDPAPTAAQLLRQGERLARAGDAVRAEQYLVAAERAGAARARVLPLLLRVCLQSGQQRRALDHLQRALHAQPEEAQLWLLAGAFAWAVGDLPGARRHLATAEAMPGPPSDVAYWQARVAISAGDPARAARQLERYLERAPEGRFSSWARFWLASEAGGST